MRANEIITEESAKSCPPATQDIALNLKNRQKAIDDYGYGPLNPDLPNTKFWMAKVEEWNLDSVDEAKASLCGNCAAFDQRKATLACIAQGIGSDAGAEDPTIEAGDLGYCRFLKFKCASRRTCDAWVTGGPLTDKQKTTEGMEPLGGPWKPGEFSRILNAFQVYTNTMGYGMEFYNWANRPQALKVLADKSETTPDLVKHTLDSLNWGQHPEEEFDDEEPVDENLHDWFGKEKWVRMDTKGNIKGPCARGSESEGKPKCLPQAKAHALGKKGRASAAQKKRREDPNPERRGPAHNVATRVQEGQQLSVQQLAQISDAALDAAYGYGRSSPGNTFGWQANLKSAAFAKQMIDQGVTDIEAISDAIHKGWNITAQAFVKDPQMFDDSKTMAPEKLQAKIAQRQKLMTQNYAQLPEDEKEKDRVVARAMLQAITGQLDEKWSAKYKSSINCSHPKGFSQRAHCAGKRKHNEDIEQEMICPDCGMCETHGDHSRDTIDEACWKGYHKEGMKKMFGKTYPNCVKNESEQGVAEGVPQPGESSGAPKQFGPDATIEPRQMTVKQIISSIPGVPYYNNVVDDWDAKDYSWGVTKKVIEYATYLKDHPESLSQLPPILVLNGKFEDGAHRVSAIWLLQQRMDPKNPLWKNAKLNVQFVKQGVAEGHADQQRKVFKKNGEPVGEVGIDRESSPGVGQYYMKHYASGKDLSGYDSFEEAVAELKHCMKQAVKESHKSCPECGGAMYPDTMINEKQDACYFKVKSRYKVWPSAYASGALVQCRKKGAANWGNKSKNESQENTMDELSRIVELSTGLSLEARAELVEEFDLIERIIDDIAEHNGVDAEMIWEDLESLTDDELYVFATTTTIMETEAWQKANNRDRTDGMSRKAVKTYRREHPGSKLQTAVTTKPSKLKKGSKASKRRKSYCSRSRGQMKMHNISCAKTPDKAICKARRRWNC